jgi:hypothetical protein
MLRFRDGQCGAGQGVGRFSSVVPRSILVGVIVMNAARHLEDEANAEGKEAAKRYFNSTEFQKEDRITSMRNDIRVRAPYYHDKKLHMIWRDGFFFILQTLLQAEVDKRS